MSTTTRNLLINNNFSIYLIFFTKMMNIPSSHDNLTSLTSSINNLLNMFFNFTNIFKITSLNQMVIYFRRLNFNIIIEINNISKFFSLFTSPLNKNFTFVAATTNNKTFSKFIKFTSKNSWGLI